MSIEDHETPLVSVSYEPRTLTATEQWRAVLCRLFPGSRGPVRQMVILSLYFCFALGVLGYGIGILGSPNLQPALMAAFFSGFGLLFPVRWWRFKRQMIAILKDLGPIVVELNREGVTLRSKNRVTKVAWGGVRDLLVSPHEVVLLFRAGDVSWIPRRAFLDPSQEGRFRDVALSGLAGPPASPRVRPRTAPADGDLR